MDASDAGGRMCHIGTPKHHSGVVCSRAKQRLRLYMVSPDVVAALLRPYGNVDTPYAGAHPSHGDVYTLYAGAHPLHGGRGYPICGRAPIIRGREHLICERAPITRGGGYPFAPVQSAHDPRRT